MNLVDNADIRDFIPQSVSAQEMATATGMTSLAAFDILEAFVAWEWADRDGDRYIINSRGLATGEKMGVVKPFDEAKDILTALESDKAVKK